MYLYSTARANQRVVYSVLPKYDDIEKIKQTEKIHKIHRLLKALDSNYRTVGIMVSFWCIPTTWGRGQSNPENAQFRGQHVRVQYNVLVLTVGRSSVSYQWVQCDVGFWPTHCAVTQHTRETNHQHPITTDKYKLPTATHCRSSASVSVVDCSRWRIWEDSEDVPMSPSLPDLVVNL